MDRNVTRALLKLTAAGFAIGGIASALVRAGNPGNMGVCVACFVRDIAGTAGGASLNMGGVAYLRPEIFGILLGAVAGALAGREFRARGGAAFGLRFVVGFIFMLAALVFLGCTVRAWLRLGGGDLNAAVGIAGLAAGIAVGSGFLKAGYALGRARDLPAAAGWIAPVAAAGLVALAVAVAAGAKPGFLTVTPASVPVTAASAPGAAPATTISPAAAAAAVAPGTPAPAPKPTPPGGKRAPLVASLLGGLAVGFLAQRTRLCTTGGIRDLILWRRYDKLLGVAGLVAGALLLNLAFGQFKLGFAGQPVAHTDALGNFAAMAVAGLAAVLMGGCPLRQVVMAGEGDADAGGALLGMFTAALVAHGTGLASSPKGIAPGALGALAVMAIVLVGIGWWRRAPEARTAAGAAPQP